MLCKHLKQAVSFFIVLVTFTSIIIGWKHIAQTLWKKLKGAWYEELTRGKSIGLSAWTDGTCLRRLEV
jgi:hypothetical protein